MAHASLPQDLIDALAARRAHLFVGSGASKAATLLSWDELIDEMKKVIVAENTRYASGEMAAFLAKSDALDIAEVFRKVVGEHRYYQFLRRLYRQPVRLAKLHKALAGLPIPTIFTTNYDKLLERAFRCNNEDDPAVVVYPGQLGHISDMECRVIKLHGDIDHPATIVLTRTDYASYGARHREFELALHQSVNDYTMLFVGFGLRDSNFQRIYADARSLYDSGKRRAYAIMTGTNAVERELWESDGLKILPASSHAHIPGLLEKLLKAVTP